MTSPRPGSRLGGRYRLTERLAFGGMGEVWKGVDEVLGRDVAIKILRPDLAGDNAFQRRFREEARTAGGLSHPGIAAVYDYGESPLAPPISEDDGDAPPDTDDISYLVMELVPGEALSVALSQEGSLDVDRTLDLVAQTARALHVAHLRGVVHRDVKPANLMVTPDRRVKVTDFGIARPQDHEPLTATGQVMGTAHYLAPELARGLDATPLSDVYALGVVAYECLAGRRPFEGDNQVAVATAHLSEPPPPLPETLQPEVRRIVELAMNKDPEQRFRGANAFAAALESARYRQLAGLPPAEEIFLGNPPATAGPGADDLPTSTPVSPTSRPTGPKAPPEQPEQAGASSGTTPVDGMPVPRRRVLSIPLVALAGLALLVGVGALISASRLSEPRTTPTTTAETPTTSPPMVIVPSSSTTAWTSTRATRRTWRSPTATTPPATIPITTPTETPTATPTETQTTPEPTTPTPTPTTTPTQATQAGAGR